MVHIQTHSAVQVGQSLTGYRSRVSVVTDEAPYDGTVFLLYPRLVVLAMRTRTCELYALLLAVAQQSLVDEHTIVV